MATPKHRGLVVASWTKDVSDVPAQLDLHLSTGRAVVLTSELLTFNPERAEERHRTIALEIQKWGSYLAEVDRQIRAKKREISRVYARQYRLLAHKLKHEGWASNQRVVEGEMLENNPTYRKLEESMDELLYVRDVVESVLNGLRQLSFSLSSYVGLKRAEVQAFSR